MSDNNLRVPFGQQNGHLFAPGEVARGLACDCLCPSCQSRLIANQGQSRRAYFSHYRNPECPGGYETAVHLMAKQIIEQAGGVTIPAHGVEVRVPLIEGQSLRETVNYPMKWCELSGIVSEQSLGPWRPDLQAWLKNNAPLRIEIAVTHFTEPEKADEVDNLMEIDLSGLDPESARDPQALGKAVLHSAPRRWYRVSLFDNLAGVRQTRQCLENQAPAAIREIEQQRENQRRHENEKRRFQTHREQKREEYAFHLNNLLRMNKAHIQERWKSAMTARCEAAIKSTRERIGIDSPLPGTLPPGVGEPVEGEWIVRTHPIIWQALVLEHLVLSRPEDQRVKVQQAVDLLRQTFGFLPWLEDLAKLKSEHKRQGRQRGAWYGNSGVWFFTRAENRAIKTPYGVLLGHLRSLSGLGYLRVEEPRSSFRVIHNDPYSIAERLRREQAPVRPSKRREVVVGPQSSEKMAEQHREREEQRRQKQKEKEAHYLECEQVLADLVERGVREARQCSYCHLLTQDFEAVQCPTCRDGALDPVVLTEDYIYSYPFRIRCKPGRPARTRPI